MKIDKSIMLMVQDQHLSTQLIQSKQLPTALQTIAAYFRVHLGRL